MIFSKIRLVLKKSISGDVLWDKEILNSYSVDASFYQVYPKIVVIPNTEKDVITVVKFAYQNKIPITVRGAGTGLVGSCLNHGIILDLKKLNQIKIKKQIAQIGVGISKGKLDKKLSKEGKFFAPNPSIGPYCSLGGILGNNASGSRTLKYGSAIDNVEEVVFVNGEGKKITLPKDEKIGQQITRISEKTKKEKFPNVSKNSCGYRLDVINSIKDTHKSIIGSEGTLGIILSAKIRIKDLPKNRLLFILEYRYLQEAANDCMKIKKLQPSAIEFVDKSTLDNIDYGFRQNTQCLLFVEFDSRIQKNRKDFKEIAKERITKEISDKQEIEKWWKYRDLALSFSLKSIKYEDRIPHIIEDATVPLENLGKLFLLIEKINKKFSTKTIMYGHAGNGNIHVRIISNRNKIKKLDKIADYYFQHVIKLGGTITGEHGDGIARSKFVKKQYGKKNYQQFRELKKLMDPKGILNPGKITSFKKSFENIEKF